MTGSEWLVVIGGLGLGYLVVSMLMGGKPVRKAEPAPSPMQEGAPVADEPPAGDVAGGRAWHEVLQVPPDASDDDVRKAYRELMSKYHPDKVASLGQELQELANRKSKEITLAYQQAMALKGREP